jgi:hypothetical protein
MYAIKYSKWPHNIFPYKALQNIPHWYFRHAIFQVLKSSGTEKTPNFNPKMNEWTHLVVQLLLSVLEQAAEKVG